MKPDDFEARNNETPSYTHKKIRKRFQCDVGKQVIPVNSAK